MTRYLRRSIITLLFVTSLLTAAASPLVKAKGLNNVFQQQSVKSREQTARIDQLFKECDELSTKAMFEELARKATEALKLSEEIGDRNRTAQALNQLGTADFLRGQLQEALSAQQRAVVIAEEVGNKKLEAKALSSIGTVLRAQGQYEDGIEFYRRALNLSRGLGDRTIEWAPLRNMGILYSEMGDFDEAEPILQSALKLAREIKNKGFEEATLISLLMLEERRHNFDLALKYAEQGLAVDAAVNNLGLHIELITDTATVYQDRGQHQKAIELFEQALAIKRTTGFHLDEPLTIALIGFSQKALGQLPEALDSLTRARTLIRRTGYSRFELVIDGGIAGVQRALGHNEEALVYYRQAVNLVEQLRTSAVSTEIARASIIGSRRDVFVDPIDLLVSLKRDTEALELAERYHARVFLDQLAQSRIDIREDMSKAQRENEDRLLTRLTAIQKELLKENLPAERESQLNKELTVAENDLEVFQAELRRTNPRYASVKYPELLHLDRIQRDLLDDKTSLVEFILGEKQSFAWVVSQNKLVTAVLPPRKEIEAAVAAYRQQVSQKVSALTLRASLAETDHASQKLYELLFQPIENALASSQRLIIAPDGVLSYLPFEALRVSQHSQLKEGLSAANEHPGQYLLERFSMTYAPSASALAALKDRKLETVSSQRTLLAFGDPIYDRKAQLMARPLSSQGPSLPLRTLYAERSFDFTSLPNTREEVRAISALYPKAESCVYLGVQAREEVLKTEELDHYRYIHFATHGLINEKIPSRSGIVLSLISDSKEDGFVQMREIMRLRLNAEMVTLSACSSGLGKLVDGEGMIGLTRAFMYAGADSVVVSLWNVSDSATAGLMRSFYQNLSSGLPKDEALRQAKLKLLHGPQPVWQHPYYWSPFVLAGEREGRSK